MSYYLGNGVKQSYEKSAYWFTKSAEQGDADAQFSLGILYYDGLGIEKNESKAIEWIQKACKNSNNYACNFLNKIKAMEKQFF